MYDNSSYRCYPVCSPPKPGPGLRHASVFLCCVGWLFSADHPASVGRNRTRLENCEHLNASGRRLREGVTTRHTPTHIRCLSEHWYWLRPLHVRYGLYVRAYRVSGIHCECRSLYLSFDIDWSPTLCTVGGDICIFTLSVS